jgi:peptidoglycan/LPS O-acetylase OafA/YrhL
MRRLPALDSLRGVAAMAVVLQHAAESAGLGTSAPNARWAVMLFFVLSGFVLALPFVERRALPWGVFLIRRLFRLWPPVLAAVGLSATLFWYFGGQPRFHGVWWHEPLGGELFARCLLLSGQHGGCASLDLPLWSLVYEARVSVVFPVLAILTLQWPRTLLGLAAVFGLCLEAFWRIDGELPQPLNVDGLFFNTMVTLHFGVLFIFGIVLAAHASQLKFGGIIAAVVAVVSINLLLIESDTAKGLGAMIAIAVVIGTPMLSRILCHPILRWMGQISYSLYLSHVPILVAFYYGFGGPLPPLMVALAIGMCLVTAEIMFRTVELPAIFAGRRIAELFQGSSHMRLEVPN